MRNYAKFGFVTRRRRASGGLVRDCLGPGRATLCSNTAWKAVSYTRTPIVHLYRKNRLQSGFDRRQISWCLVVLLPPIARGPPQYTTRVQSPDGIIQSTTACRRRRRRQKKKKRRPKIREISPRNSRNFHPKSAIFGRVVIFVDRSNFLNRTKNVKSTGVKCQ